MDSVVRLSTVPPGYLFATGIHAERLDSVPPTRSFTLQICAAWLLFEFGLLAYGWLQQVHPCLGWPCKKPIPEITAETIEVGYGVWPRLARSQGELRADETVAVGMRVSDVWPKFM